MNKTQTSLGFSLNPGNTRYLKKGCEMNCILWYHCSTEYRVSNCIISNHRSVLKNIMNSSSLTTCSYTNVPKRAMYHRSFNLLNPCSVPKRVMYHNDNEVIKDDERLTHDSSGLLYIKDGPKKIIFSPTLGIKMPKTIFYQSWYQLEDSIESEYIKDPHLGLRIAVMDLKEPYLRCDDTTIISLAVMRLLIKYVYNMEFKYRKFNIGYNINTPRGDTVSFNIANAIELVDSSGNAVPKKVCML